MARVCFFISISTGHAQYVHVEEDVITPTACDKFTIASPSYW